AEVIQAAVIYREVRIQRQDVDVAAPLPVVRAVRVREVVGELKALLGAAHKAEWLAPHKGEAWDLHAHGAATGPVRKVVEQAAARVLEAELVHLVAAEPPQVLAVDVGVAEGLLRGARE